MRSSSPTCWWGGSYTGQLKQRDTSSVCLLLAHRTIGAFAVADLTPIRNTIGETSLHAMSSYRNQNRNPSIKGHLDSRESTALLRRSRKYTRSSSFSGQHHTDGIKTCTSKQSTNIICWAAHLYKRPKRDISNAFCSSRNICVRAFFIHNILSFIPHSSSHLCAGWFCSNP